MTVPSESNSAAASAGIGFVLPPDWWVLDLRDEAALSEQIHGLVLRQVGRRDEDATMRGRLRRELQIVTGQAAAAGGVHMALSLMHAGGVPVPASLTTYRVGVGPSATLADILTAVAHDGRVVEAVDGPLGEMARCVGIFRPDGPVDDDEDASGRVAQVRADYWLDVGDGRGITLLAFSSPLADLAEAMVDLFESVVSTVHVFPDALGERAETVVAT